MSEAFELSCENVRTSKILSLQTRAMMKRQNYGKKKHCTSCELQRTNTRIFKSKGFIPTHRNTTNNLNARGVPICPSILWLHFSDSNKKQNVKKLSRRQVTLFADYNHDCHEVQESQLGQLENVEQITNFWKFDQSQSPSTKTKTPEKSITLLSKYFFG